MDYEANKIHTPDLCPGFQEKLMREGGLRFFIYGCLKILCEREGLTYFYLSSIAKYIPNVSIKYVKTSIKVKLHLYFPARGRERTIFDSPPPQFLLSTSAGTQIWSMNLVGLRNHMHSRT